MPQDIAAKPCTGDGPSRGAACPSLCYVLPKFMEALDVIPLKIPLEHFYDLIKSFSNLPAEINT